MQLGAAGVELTQDGLDAGLDGGMVGAGRG